MKLASKGALLCLAIAGLAPACAAPAAEASSSASAAVRPSPVEFAGEAASPDTRRMADWVIASGDNDGLSFVIVDKLAARVFAFSSEGRLQGASPALLGLARGDDSPAGIGTRRLADIAPSERITPSGRFVARLGRDLGTQDVVWVDYGAAISLHRVFTGTPSEHRLERLATPSPLDNRISYGCINVPAKFYEGVVRPMFSAARGIVYVLPETRPLAAVFPGVAGARVLAAR